MTQTTSDDDDFKIRRAWYTDDLAAPTADTVAGCHVVIEGMTNAGRPRLRAHVVVWAPELLDDIAESLRAMAENLAAGAELAAADPTGRDRDEPRHGRGKRWRRGGGGSRPGTR